MVSVRWIRLGRPISNPCSMTNACSPSPGPACVATTPAGGDRRTRGWIFGDAHVRCEHAGVKRAARFDRVGAEQERRRQPRTGRSSAARTRPNARGSRGPVSSRRGRAPESSRTNCRPPTRRARSPQPRSSSSRPIAAARRYAAFTYLLRQPRQVERALPTSAPSRRRDSGSDRSLPPAPAGGALERRRCARAAPRFRPSDARRTATRPRVVMRSGAMRGIPGGSTNTVSGRLNSRAIPCIASPFRPSGSSTTASGFPAKRVSVNTSNVWKRRCTMGTSMTYGRTAAVISPRRDPSAPIGCADPSNVPCVSLEFLDGRNLVSQRVALGARIPGPPDPVPSARAGTRCRSAEAASNTCAWMRPSIGPPPKRRASHSAAHCVASSRREASRVSISPVGVPDSRRLRRRVRKCPAGNLNSLRRNRSKALRRVPRAPCRRHDSRAGCAP